MKIIRLDRCKGKTTRLIQESARTNTPIITHLLSRVNQIKKQAEEMELDIPHPIYLKKDVRASLRGYDLKNGVLIDDFELLLGWLLNVDINTVTTSCEILTEEDEMREICKLDSKIYNIIISNNELGYEISNIYE